MNVLYKAYAWIVMAITANAIGGSLAWLITGWTWISWQWNYMAFCALLGFVLSGWIVDKG